MKEHGMSKKNRLEQIARVNSWDANAHRQARKKRNRRAESIRRGMYKAAKNPINPAARVPQMG